MRGENKNGMVGIGDRGMVELGGGGKVGDVSKVRTTVEGGVGVVI